MRRTSTGYALRPARYVSGVGMQTSAAGKAIACGLAAGLIALGGLSEASGAPAPPVTSARPAKPVAITPGSRVRLVATGLTPSQRCTLDLIPLRRGDGRDGRAMRLPCGRTDRTGRVALSFRFPRRPTGGRAFRRGDRVALEVVTVAPGGGGAAATRTVVVIR